LKFARVKGLSGSGSLHGPAVSESTLIHFAPLLTTPARGGQYHFHLSFLPRSLQLLSSPVMPLLSRFFLLMVSVAPACLFAQPNSSSEAVRVSVLLNTDGSRTVYEADNANHKSVATTTEPGGKLREKIRYDLDESGRFLRSEVYGPKEQFRFFAKYRYDADNHLIEETHFAKDQSVIGKIVFRYDAAGRQIGYSSYDGAGRLQGQTTVPVPKRP